MSTAPVSTPLAWPTRGGQSPVCWASHCRGVLADRPRARSPTAYHRSRPWAHRYMEHRRTQSADRLPQPHRGGMKASPPALKSLRRKPPPPQNKTPLNCGPGTTKAPRSTVAVIVGGIETVFPVPSTHEEEPSCGAICCSIPSTVSAGRSGTPHRLRNCVTRSKGPTRYRPGTRSTSAAEAAPT
jgi:hypothetical protein